MQWRKVARIPSRVYVSLPTCALQIVAIGHHRYAAVVENNHGLLLLSLERFEEAEAHLRQAQQPQALDHKISEAQVDDTLARLYAATNRLDVADLYFPKSRDLFRVKR